VQLSMLQMHFFMLMTCTMCYQRRVLSSGAPLPGFLGSRSDFESFLQGWEPGVCPCPWQAFRTSQKVHPEWDVQLIVEVFARPLGSGIYHAKLGSGREVQMQTVVFDAVPCPLPPMLQPVHAEQFVAAPKLRADTDSESDNEALEAPKGQRKLEQQLE
jgi:hypothetical protein